MTDHSAHINHFWATIIVEDLFRRGIEHFFISPGSRSTPLVLAAAKHPEVQTTVHYDERGSSFAALGFAKERKAMGSKGICRAAWVCTSGTALANALPAAIEASMSHTPLFLLTADRPPELKNRGANQTIDQDQIFQPYLRSQKSLEEPRDLGVLHEVIEEIGSLLDSASGFDAGPVHLNLGFRKPLEPTPGYIADLSQIDNPTIIEWLKNSSAEAKDYSLTSTDLNELEIQSETLCIASGGCNKDQFGTLLEFAKRKMLPFYIDASCPFSADSQNIVSYASFYPKIVLSETKSIVHLGDRITSKSLQETLRSFGGSYYHLSDHSDTIDPINLEPNVYRSYKILDSGSETSMDRSYLDLLLALDQSVDQSLSELLKDRFTEAGIMRVAIDQISGELPVWIGNSLAIRQFDSYVRKSKRGSIRGSNRGVSGIDGQLASAAGFSLAAAQRGFIVLGDLGFLHDLSSLNLLRSSPMTVLVINNDGGGIFSMLPIEEHKDIFEEFFATPHHLSFDSAAKMFGLTYSKPTNLGELIEAIQSSLSSETSTIIEVESSRKETKELTLKLGEDIRGKLSKLN